MSPAVASGTRRSLVTLESPDVVGLDGHGGYTTTWAPLDPPTAFAAIAPATEVQQERAVGGTVVASATHVLHLPYHPQVSVQTRVTLNGRTLQVLSRRDPDERHVELVLVCAEVLGTVPIPPVAIAAALSAQTGLMVLTSATFRIPPVLSYAQRVVADGASHYWRLGEPAGTIAGDRIGYAHGTISGGVTVNQVGALSDGDTAMSFNGTTGQIVVTSVAIPVICTVEAWIKGNDAGQRPILCLSGEAPLFALSNKRLNVYDAANGPGGGSSTTVLTDGVWHHAAFVLTASTYSFYIDGVFSNSIAATRTVAGSGQTGIGRDLDFPGGNPNGFFLGSIDEVAIYPRALTATEIAAHYAAGMAA